jgi:membrane protein required for colicin V production
MAFMRGASREIIGICAWLFGAYLAFIYTPQLQSLLESQVETPEFRYLIVFLVILIIFLILGALLGKLLNNLVKALGLSGLDRLLGIFFGLARGLLLVVIFIMIANYTPMVKSPSWNSSWFIAHLKSSADQLLVWMENSGFLPETQPQQR